MTHIALHFLAPALIAVLFFPKLWRIAFVVMLATLLVDVDHLLADPIYEPNRCSIGFHPLHKLWFIFLYVTLCFIPKTRFVGIGLVIHMALDSMDCKINSGIWTQ